jgi:hypothetical protein
MILVSRYRGTGTETFHRDGQQRLGLGDCQGRTGEGQTRHGYLVSVAYSLLMRSLHQTHLYDWARRTLTTIGAACRAVKAETLERIVDWIVDKLTVEHWSIPEMKAVLAQHEAGSTLQNFSLVFVLWFLSQATGARALSIVACHTWESADLPKTLGRDAH